MMAVLPLGLALTLTPARGEDATLIARALAAAGARDWGGAGSYTPLAPPTTPYVGVSLGGASFSKPERDNLVCT
ncbi:hypothetical protein IX54_16395, partial [Paracoccus sanguinis]